MYRKFAYIYDSLVDVNYDDLLDIIKDNIEEGSTILDLACGTGTMISLLRDSYNMVGADLSVEMLEIARGKNPEVRLFQHDLKEDFNIDSIDAIICTVDSINYLLNTNELENLFKNVSNNLTEGMFIFDCHAESKLSRFDDYLYVDLDEEISYVWKVDVEENLLNHYLTFFIKEDELYERFDEEHVQRVYSEEVLKKLLDKYNFKYDCKYLEDRIVFICNKE